MDKLKRLQMGEAVEDLLAEIDEAFIHIHHRNPCPPPPYPALLVQIPRFVCGSFLLRKSVGQPTFLHSPVCGRIFFTSHPIKMNGVYESTLEKGNAKRRR